MAIVQNTQNLAFTVNKNTEWIADTFADITGVSNGEYVYVKDTDEIWHKEKGDLYEVTRQFTESFKGTSIANKKFLNNIRGGLTHARRNSNFNIIKIGDSNTEFVDDGEGWLNALLSRGFNISSYGNTSIWGGSHWDGYLGASPNIDYSKWEVRNRVTSIKGNSLNMYSIVSTSDVNNFYIYGAYYNSSPIDRLEKIRQIEIHYIAKSGGGIFEIKTGVTFGNYAAGTVVGTIDTSDLAVTGLSGGVTYSATGTNGYKVAYITLPADVQMYYGIKVNSQSTNGVELLNIICRAGNQFDGNSVGLLRFGQIGLRATELSNLNVNLFQEQIQAITKQRSIAGTDYGLILLRLGTNDCKDGISVVDFKNSLTTIVQRIKTTPTIANYGVMLMGIPHYNTSDYGASYGGLTWGGSTDLIRQYNVAIKEVAIDENIAFFDAELIAKDFKEMYDNEYYTKGLGVVDNIHYNIFYSKMEANTILDIIE